MSKLAIVRDALQADPGVLIVGVEERTHLPNPNGIWTQIIDFVIAPAKAIYRPKALQSFMLGLVPLEATRKDDFRSWDLGEMEFGRLYFDETIGTSTTIQTIVITDPDVPVPDSYLDGSLTINEGGATSQDLLRRTRIYVYPDLRYARRAMKGEDKHSTYSLYVPIAELVKHFRLGQTDERTTTNGNRVS